MSWSRAFLLVAVGLLVLVVLGMAAVAHAPVPPSSSELGPFPTGDGDRVVVAPRAAP